MAISTKIIHGQKDGREWWTDSDLKLWTMCWQDGACTTLHDHGIGTTAEIYVVRGSVITKRWNDGQIWSGYHFAGQRFRVGPGQIHGITALKDATITIHRYSPALKAMNFFTIVDG